VGGSFDFPEDTLSRHWERVRTDLAALGITPIASYTAQFMGNPNGAQTQRWTFPGTLVASITWDFQRLLRVPNLSFNVGASWASGHSLSAQDIGNVFTVQSAFTGTGRVNLNQMYLQQQLFDGALTIAAGRLAPANTFALLPVFNNYVNDGINGAPAALGINDPSFASSPPGAEWGAQVLYNVTPGLEVAAAVFNTNPKSAAGNKNGVNFAFNQGNTGVLTAGQVSYQFDQSPGGTGLPGLYAIGGSYNSNAFNTLSGSPPHGEREL
jgi:porin